MNSEALTNRHVESGPSGATSGTGEAQRADVNASPSRPSRRHFLFSAIRSVDPHPMKDAVAMQTVISTQEAISMQEAIYALRYEVYCLECGFLPPEDYSDGLESDEYDPHSTHFTAHAADSRLVGSVRLVRPPDAELFPFEQHGAELFPEVKLPPKELSGEISRLVVHRNWRRRVGDTLAGVSREFLCGTALPGGASSPRYPERRSNSPEILLGLYREMYRYSRENGVRYWYAAMERALARALGRLDFVFKPIGQETDYYGPVIPYLADLDELEDRLRERNPAMLDWFLYGD